MALGRRDIVRLFRLLNDELCASGLSGEVYLVGGAVMCTVFEARHSTQDLDASFRPVRAIREAVQRIASAHDYPEHWLNDAVKGFLSDRGQFNPYLQLSHLQVFTASAAYLLAMKCLAMRLGAEFHDEQDIRYLLRYLNVADYSQALGIIEQYYPLQRFPQKTLYALQELLEGT